MNENRSESKKKEMDKCRKRTREHPKVDTCTSVLQRLIDEEGEVRSGCADILERILVCASTSVVGALQCALKSIHTLVMQRSVWRKLVARDYSAQALYVACNESPDGMRVNPKLAINSESIAGAFLDIWKRYYILIKSRRCTAPNASALSMMATGTLLQFPMSSVTRCLSPPRSQMTAICHLTTRVREKYGYIACILFEVDGETLDHTVRAGQRIYSLSNCILLTCGPGQVPELGFVRVTKEHLQGPLHLGGQLLTYDVGFIRGLRVVVYCEAPFEFMSVHIRGL